MPTHDLLPDEVWERAARAAWASRPPALRLKEAAQLGTALLRLDERGQAHAITAGDPRFRNPRLARHLLTWSAEFRLREPPRALALARAALKVAELLPPEAAPLPLKHDLVAEAWAAVGNLQRIVGWLPEAEESFERANQLLRKGTGDPVLEALILVQEALVVRAEGRLDEARVLAEKAAPLAAEGGDRHLAARAKMIAGVTYGYSGRPAEAVACLAAAAPGLDAEAEPAAGVILLQNLALFLGDAGQVHLAAALLHRSRGLNARAEPSVRLWATWTEARLHTASGNLAAAHPLLEEVRQVCRDKGRDHDLALATVDLCLVWAKAGDAHKVNELARELSPILERGRLPPAFAEELELFAERASCWKVDAAYIQTALENLRAPLEPPALPPIDKKRLAQLWPR